VYAGKSKIVPFSQTVSLSAAGGRGGFVWNRPVSILAVNASGGEQVIPVVDVTRRIQFSLLGAAIFWALLLLMFGFVSKRRNTDG
jgi:hypothetical protein